MVIGSTQFVLHRNIKISRTLNRIKKIVPAHTEVDPEFAIVIGAAQAVATECKEVGLDCEQRSRQIDWKRVVALAERHCLIPHLNVYLRENEEIEVPNEILSDVHSRFLNIRRRNLLFAGELNDLVKAFDTADVRALPFKGPIIANLAYGDLGLRQFGDLDFLVPRSDIPAATQVLREANYSLKTEIEPYNIDDIPKGATGIPFPFDGELCFVHEDEIKKVELRFARGTRFGRGSIDVESLWAEHSVTKVANRDFPALSPTDRLVVLSSHGSKHLWHRLEWVANLTGVLERCDLDWKKALGRAQDWRVLEELYLGAIVADRFFNIDIPEYVLGNARENQRCERVASKIWKQYVDDPTWVPDANEEMRLRGELHGDVVQRYLRRAVRPTRGDFQLVDLPRPLWPLYRVVRMVRGPIKLFTERLRRSSAK